MQVRELLVNFLFHVLCCCEHIASERFRDDGEKARKVDKGSAGGEEARTGTTPTRRDVKIQPFVQLHIYSMVVFMYNSLVLDNALWIKGLEPSLA